MITSPVTSTRIRIVYFVSPRHTVTISINVNMTWRISGRHQVNKLHRSHVGVRECSPACSPCWLSPIILVGIVLLLHYFQSKAVSWVTRTLTHRVVLYLLVLPCPSSSSSLYWQNPIHRPLCIISLISAVRNKSVEFVRFASDPVSTLRGSREASSSAW